MSLSSLSREFVMCLSKNKKPRILKCNGFLKMLDLLYIFKNLYKKIVLLCHGAGCVSGDKKIRFKISVLRGLLPLQMMIGKQIATAYNIVISAPQYKHCINNFVFLYTYIITKFL